MTAKTARVVCVVLAASLALAGCTPTGKPVARVGTRTLTSVDFTNAARGNELQYSAVPAEAKQALLMDLVRRELMLESAKAHGLDTTVYARQYLQNVTEKATLEALYARLAPQDPGVTEAEAKRFYEWRGISAEAHVIYAPDRVVIEAAAADLRRGETFASVADRYNMPGSLPPGGRVGMVVPGGLFQPLDDALRTQPLGKVGGPYETPQGWFLLLVTKREPAERNAYEVMQGQLVEMLRQRKVRQVMTRTLVGLRDAYHARTEKDAAARMFQLLTPARVGDTMHAPLSDADKAFVLARWDGGTYTLGEAWEDLQRPDVQKPAASMTSAIEQWIQSQTLTRLAKAEAKRRHVADEPEVQRRIRNDYERYLLESEFQSIIAPVPPPDEAMMRETWDMLKGQYRQLARAKVQWVIAPDTTTAMKIARHGGHNGGTIADAVRMAGSPVQVHEDVLTFPTSDPDWVTMRETLQRMQPGEWAGPEMVPGGFKFFQLIDKVQDELTFEKLPADMAASLQSNAWQMAREKRLAQYTDSLQTVLRPNLYKENLASLPWPVPGPIDVGR